MSDIEKLKDLNKQIEHKENKLKEEKVGKDRSIAELTRQKADLEKKRNDLNRKVSEIKQVVSAYKQVYDKITKEVEAIKDYRKNKKDVEDAIKDRKNVIESKIADVDGKIATTETEMNTAKGNFATAEADYKSDKQDREEKYNSLKMTQKRIVDKFNEIKNFKELIVKEEEKNTKVYIYIQLKELEDKLTALASEMKTPDKLENELDTAWEAVQPEEVKKLAKNVDDAKANLNTKVEELEKLKKERRKNILEAIEKAPGIA